MKYDQEKQKNIKSCSAIRDSEESKPIAVIQAVRAIIKLLPKTNADSSPEFNKCLKALIKIRDDMEIEDTIRIMAMNSINTMLENVTEVKTELTEEDIMKKIRGKKK